MFERFTPDAREVIAEAQELARRMGHSWVGCEHFLLAATRSRTWVGAMLHEVGLTGDAVEDAVASVLGTPRGDSDERATLEVLGIDLDRVREVAERSFGPGALGAVRTSRRRPYRFRLQRRRPSCTRSTDHPPLTPRAKRCLELSLREALRLEHDYVGVEHIALALLSRDDTVAWRALLRLGVLPAELTRTINNSLRRPS